MERFIYRDLLNCDLEFYKTTKFFSYDQFLIELITRDLKSDCLMCQNLALNYEKQSRRQYKGNGKTLANRPQTTSSCLLLSGQVCELLNSKWVFILIGTAVGIVLTLSSVYLLKYINDSPNRKLYRYSKNRGVDLIRPNEFVSDLTQL